MSRDPVKSSESALTKFAAACAIMGLSMLLVVLLEPRAVWLLASGLLLMGVFMCIVLGQASDLASVRRGSADSPAGAPWGPARVALAAADADRDSDIMCAPTTFAAKPVWVAPARRARNQQLDPGDDRSSRFGFRSTLAMSSVDDRRAA